MQRHLLDFYKVAKWRDNAPLRSSILLNPEIRAIFFEKTKILFKNLLAWTLQTWRNLIGQAPLGLDDFRERARRS